MKKKYFLNLALLCAVVFAFNGVAFGWGTTGGDGSRYDQLQETAVFFNNSGRTLSTGDVVVIDMAGSGVASGSTLGAYVNVIATADARSARGVVASVSSADQTPVVVVTAGPAQCRIDDSTDPVALGTTVGTSTTAGHAGSGSFLGIAMDPGAGGDNELIWIWVNLMH